MPNIDDFLDLAAGSGDTIADDTDIVPAMTPDSPYTLPPDLQTPIITPDSEFRQPLLGAVPGTLASPGAGPGAVDPRARMAANILSLLLGVGGVAGAAQGFFGRPPQSTVTPKLSPQAIQALGGAQQQFGQSGNILQALLAALQNPQIPPGLSLLTEQAFQPQLGSLFSQATEAGRRRGFHDAPATSPPGGAIFGPGLADLQGQMAAAKLHLYQNNLNNLLQTFAGSRSLAQGQGQLAATLPVESRTQQPRPTILQTLGGLNQIIGMIGGLLGAVNPKSSAPSSSLSANA